MIALFAAAFAQDCPDGQIQTLLDATTTLTLSLRDCAVRERVVVRGGRTLTLQGVAGTTAVLAGDGLAVRGAQLVVEDGTLRLVGLTVAPNGVPGVLIAGEDASAELEEVVVTPIGAGSGVVVDSGSLSIVGSLFSGGVAARGPHVDLRAGVATVERTTFLSGVALTRGGSIAVSAGGELAVVDSTFLENRAGNGGALSVVGGAASVARTLFDRNLAIADGGAIHVAQAGDLRLDGVELYTNRAANGGALAAVGSGEVRTSTFCGNVASADGGGAAVGSTTGLRFTNVRFIENEAFRGGGLAAREPGVLVEHANFLGNRATGGGAAAWGPGVGLSMTHSLFAWSGPSAAVAGASIDAVVTWQNSATASPSAEIGRVVEQDPILVDFTLGASCASRGDLHAFDSPLRTRAEGWEPVADPPAGCGPGLAADDGAPDLGAYGGACGFVDFAWVDGDGDGAPAIYDCDDSDPDSFPGAAERWYDGVDQDCRRDDDFDQDGDEFRAEEYDGGDCDDTDPSIYPGAADIPFVQDRNCDGVVDNTPGTLVLEPGCVRVRARVGGEAALWLLPLVGLRRRVRRPGRRPRGRTHPD